MAKQTPDLVDLGFMDARIKLIDIAAFLDRLDRHGQAGDYRVEALKRAFGEVLKEGPGRAARILELLSDQSTGPVEAATIQGAFGAPNPES